MSVKLMTLVFEESEARGNERLVLLAIADEANDDGKGGYPGFELLAHKCRLPKTTVRRAVDRLEERGELRVFRPEKRGRGHITRYEVTLGEKRAKVAQLEDEEKRAEKGQNGPQRAAEPTLTSDDDEYAVRETRNAKDTHSRELLNEGFERFWDAYPRKTAKGSARSAWPKAVAKEAQRVIAPLGPGYNLPEWRQSRAIDVIVGGARHYAHDPNREDAYTAHASTWLNGERWHDPPLPPRPGRPQANGRITTNTEYASGEAVGL